jgi:hypothetical protein
MNNGSRIFMLVGASALVIFLGLPLLLFPMKWAQRLGWRVPEETELANYLGRSLGGVALAIAFMAFLAAYDPWRYQVIFSLIILIGIFMTAVHAYGFIRKAQPAFENLETLIYPLISLLAWILYPQAG